MVMSKFDTEKLVGLQLRAVAGDISREFRTELLEKLYSDDEIGKICAKWHWAVSAYFADQKKARTFIAYIQLAYDDKENLDEDEEWKQIMRFVIGEEFFNMMDKFTQIPQLSARNIAKPKEKPVRKWGIDND